MKEIEDIKVGRSDPQPPNLGGSNYFGELGHGLKTLAVGMRTSWKEYWKDFFTNKSTEQYPENRKTTLHVAKRHRGRLVFKRDENGAYKCTACTLCEKACPNGTIKIVSHMAEDPETGKKKKVLDDYQYDLEGARRLSVRPGRLHVLPALY